MAENPSTPETEDIGRIDAIAAQVLLHELLESSKVATVILAADFRPVWGNEACEIFLGQERAALLAQDMRETWNGPLRRIFLSPATFIESVLESYAQGTHLEGLEGRVTTPRDGDRWLEYSSQPISDGPYQGGRIEYFSDVTTQRRLEDQLRQSQKMEAVGRLAGGVAHDFNNLLTAINGYSQLLSQITPEGTQRGYIEEIRKAGSRAVDITANLMRISRRQAFHPEAVDLGALVGDLRGMLQQMIGEDVALETSFAADLGRVEADPGQMEQVLLNLAVNARDAMPSGGRLAVSASNVRVDRRYLDVRPGSYVCLRVRDTGTGIEPDILEHIFEPLFTTKEKGKGTGFGLAMVYASIQRSHGHIHVESTPGAGTTFLLYLPRLEARPLKAQATLTDSPPERGDETILLVEDDSGVRALVRELLEQQGYTVMDAKSAREALRLMEVNPCRVDLLVSDVVMPAMSGPDLARQLTPRCPEMKILFISGYTDSFISRHGLSRAQHVVLQKPFDAHLLAEKVRGVLDS